LQRKCFGCGAAKLTEGHSIEFAGLSGSAVISGKASQPRFNDQQHSATPTFTFCIHHFTFCGFVPLRPAGRLPKEDMPRQARRAGQRSGKSAKSVRSVFPYCQLCPIRQPFLCPFGAPKGPKAHPPKRIGDPALECRIVFDCQRLLSDAGSGFLEVLCISLHRFLTVKRFYLKLRCSWSTTVLSLGQQPTMHA
jgi:hypothetical protein